MEHAPLHLDVVAGMTPVTQGVEVAHEEALVEAGIDAGEAAGDLAGDEGFAAPGAFVIEEDAVAGIHAVGLAVVDGDPVGVELGDAVGAAGIEGGGFLLGDLLDEAVELGGGGLVDAGFGGEAEDANSLEDAEGAEGVGIGGVFRSLEGDSDVTLGAEVVDLVGLDLLNDADQVGRIGEIAVVEDEAGQGAADVDLMGVLVEVIDAIGVEAAGAALDAMDAIALLQQEFGEVGAVLAGDACDQSCFVYWLGDGSPQGSDARESEEAILAQAMDARGAGLTPAEFAYSGITLGADHSGGLFPEFAWDRV